MKFTPPQIQLLSLHVLLDSLLLFFQLRYRILLTLNLSLNLRKKEKPVDESEPVIIIFNYPFQRVGSPTLKIVAYVP
jgi:hypothetical protein